MIAIWRMVRSQSGELGTAHFSLNGGKQGALKKMTGTDDLKTVIRRNKLVGMWAAARLGLAGRDADAYSDALAVGTLDPELSDVFGKIRKDFDAAGVVESDQQILRIMDEFMLRAQRPASQAGAHDAAAVMLARNLTSR